MITQNDLISLLHYDPLTGVFTALVDTGKWRSGRVVGTTNGYGYRQICVRGKVYLAHRLAWLYEYGDFPQGGLDHINHDRSDNRIVNLREATQAQNHQNRSAVTGAYQRKKDGKWIAQIKVARKCQHLGVFDTREEAHAAYRVAKKLFHTFHPGG